MAGGCAGCEGGCCRGHHVPLCGVDVVRIARAQQLAPEVFVRLVPGREDFRALVRIDGREHGHALALARRPDACVFLVELAGTARCGIYDDRPVVCRTYPAELHDGAARIRRDAVCPRGSWHDAEPDPPAWRLELLRMELEWTIYDRVVARFNAAGGAHDEPAFFAWLLAAYERLDPLRERLGEDGLTAAALELPGGRFLADVEAAL